MSEKSWYYAKDGKSQGPFPESIISSLLESGVISQDTLAWSEGISEWVPVSSINLSIKKEVHSKKKAKSITKVILSVIGAGIIGALIAGVISIASRCTEGTG